LGSDDNGGVDFLMPTLVKFGDITFPINPETMTRIYRRALSRKQMLGGSQVLESKHRNLIEVSFEGTLTGSDARSKMDAFESYMEAHQPKTLITPTYPAGEDALLTDLEFRIEQIKFYERLIHFRMGLLLVSTITTPSWSLQVEDQDGFYHDVAGLMEFSVERQFGGVAAAFDFTADNRNGQNAYPVFDYGRNVKIELGYSGSNVRRLWGLIDTIDYGVTKAGGSVVRVSGRDYGNRLLEGFPVDGTYADCYPDGQAPGGTPPEKMNMIKDLLTGVPGVVKPLMDTGVGIQRLGSVDYSQWETGLPFPSYLVFRNETRLEAIKKISGIYRMEFYMDADDLNYGKPQLVWRQESKISELLEDAKAGDNHAHVSYCAMWGQKSGFLADINGSEAVSVIDYDPADNRVDFTAPISRDFLVADGAILTNYSEFAPKKKTWGTNIVSLQLRDTGIPMLNRIEVYGDGYYAIADANEEYILPYNASHQVINYGYDPNLVAKYRSRRQATEDHSIKSQTVADVTAQFELLKLEKPELEIRITVVGDKELIPGQYILFTDNNTTGWATAYRLMNIIDRISTDGFTSELVLRRLIQTASVKLLSQVIKDQAKYASGSQTLKDTKSMAPVIGTVIP